MSRVNKFDDEYFAERTVTVAESGCMIWMLGTVKGGYGKVSKRGKSSVAHRESWIAKNGPIPEGMILCHKCDVPSCVNPDHLFLGTHKENSRDMVRKGRSAKGSKIAKSVLTEDLVRQIRSENGTYAEIGRKFGVYQGTIRHVMLRETWRHVP